MKGTVISVLPNQTFQKNSGGTYTATVLKLLTDPSNYQGHEKPAEETEKRIFTNSPCHALVLQLKKGDRVELKMVKNGNFWNISDVILLETAPSGGASAPATEPARPEASPAQYPMVLRQSDEDIRQFAVTQSNGVISAIYSEGSYFKKASSPEIIIDSLLEGADRIVRFVKGETKLPAPATVAAPQSEDGELPNDEDIPF